MKLKDLAAATSVRASTSQLDLVYERWLRVLPDVYLRSGPVGCGGSRRVGYLRIPPGRCMSARARVSTSRCSRDRPG